jgi:hypothetical protein
MDIKMDMETDTEIDTKKLECQISNISKKFHPISDIMSDFALFSQIRIGNSDIRHCDILFITDIN